MICQIESREGVENASAIAAVPGVDVLWIGHGDLTHDLGIPNQFEHADFIAAFGRVREAARAHGRALGLQPRNAKQAEAFLRLGADVLSLGADFFVYQDALSSALADLRKLTSGESR